jgi:hypothetical protein
MENYRNSFLNLECKDLPQPTADVVVKKHPKVESLVFRVLQTPEYRTAPVVRRLLETALGGELTVRPPDKDKLGRAAMFDKLREEECGGGSNQLLKDGIG